MNNNCTKCGNPLQPGTTICPICGTNNINATPAAAPAATPAATPAPVAPAAVPVTPETPAPAPAATPAAPEVATPAAAPAAPAAPGVPVVGNGTAPAEVPAKPAKEKKPVNKKLIIIIAIIAVVIIAGAVIAMVVINGSSEPEVPEPSNNNKSSTAAANKMALNGFSFTLPAGWSIDTTGGTTALVDKDVTTIIHLLYENYSITDSNNDSLKNYFTNRGYDNVNVTDKTFAGKKGIVVSASLPGGTYYYDFYYIDATEKVMGAGVVYVDSESKNKNSAVVDQIMNSLSYSEAANMASSVSMYSKDIVSNFSNALISNESASDTPSGETPSNPEEEGSTVNPGDADTPDENPSGNEGGRF